MLKITPLMHMNRKPGIIASQGFTFIGAIILVAVTGIALTGVSRYWSTMIKREKEKELLFRGDQIRKAIASYYNSTPSGKSPEYPAQLIDLIKDPRFLHIKRHLRAIYPDPMTVSGKWGLVRTPKGAIKGVFSQSDLVPQKKSNFPAPYEDFEKAANYSHWKFVYEPEPKLGKKRGKAN